MRICVDTEKPVSYIASASMPVLQIPEVEPPKEGCMNAKQIRAYKDAHNAVRRAIRSGELNPGPCETCGNESCNYAHHDDYSKPLSVRWLCPGCHLRHHMGFKRADWNISKQSEAK